MICQVERVHPGRCSGSDAGIERHSEVVHLVLVDIRQATSLPLGDPAVHPLKSGIWRRRPARERMDRELPGGSDEDAQA